MNQLQPFADDIWCVRAPLSFFGVHVGTQMTVVRLSDGGLLLHSPIPIDAALKREIDALGPVRHIVCPNLFHHLYGGDAKSLWPDALLHGPAALHAKRRDLRFDGLFSEQLHPDWQADLTAITIEGSALGETVLFHPRSRTLITVDLVENFQSSDHAPTRWYLKLGGVHRQIGWHRLLRFVYRDRAKARACVERILALPIDKVTVAHGDNIPADGRNRLREGLRWLL